MEKTKFHALETGAPDGNFDHLAVRGDYVLISCGYSRVTFNLQTAEQIIDILTGYTEDSRRARADYYSEIDRIRDTIKTNGGNIDEHV